MPETVYVGIDLGTSRTSITTSTGKRETVWSYVGYPEDHVSRKALGGRDVIFGEEAAENRMSLDFHRPLAKGVIKDDATSQKAVRDLLEHVLSGGVGNVLPEEHDAVIPLHLVPKTGVE